jgi:hypothetical protein
MNTELLLQVKTAVLRFPENVDMAGWTDGELIAAGPKCGTTGCIAGWALAIHRGSYDDDDKMMGATHDEAVKVLDLGHHQAQSLFHVDGWPKPLETRYLQSETNADSKGMAQAVSDRIDAFIAEHSPAPTP